jgi:thiol-disulfide isomerase/thioredoxin
MDSSPNPTPASPSWRNAIVALVAVALAVALYLGVSSPNGSTSLASQAKASMPLETALANDRPTLLEFYADWCTSCQAMAPELAAIKQQYTNRVNFTMLNVDNPKWLPELMKYRVDGIPHFIFFDTHGKPLVQAIGEQPSRIVTETLDAAIANRPIVTTAPKGQVSDYTPSQSRTIQDDPRAHSS